jgi:phosphopentomutase
LLITGEEIQKGINLGVLPTFADLAATIAEIFQVNPPSYGKSFVSKILTV